MDTLLEIGVIADDQTHRPTSLSKVASRIISDWCSRFAWEQYFHTCFYDLLRLWTIPLLHLCSAYFIIFFTLIKVNFSYMNDESPPNKAYSRSSSHVFNSNFMLVDDGLVWPGWVVDSLLIQIPPTSLTVFTIHAHVALLSGTRAEGSHLQREFAQRFEAVSVEKNETFNQKQRSSQWVDPIRRVILGTVMAPNLERHWPRCFTSWYGGAQLTVKPNFITSVFLNLLTVK